MDLRFSDFRISDFWFSCSDHLPPKNLPYTQPCEGQQGDLSKYILSFCISQHLDKVYSNAMQENPGAYESPHYKSQRKVLHEWAKAEGYSDYQYFDMVVKVEELVRKDDAFAHIVEEWIQYNIDYHMYDKICKYIQPFQHERNSNHVQLGANMVHACSRGRRAERHAR
jgi:hypothetical protein